MDATSPRLQMLSRHIEQDTDESIDRNERFTTYIDRYSFGVPFSYWKKYDLYPYCPPKYGSLKTELLQNKICTISQEQYTKIYNKALKLYAKIEKILGHNGDKNTAFAHHITHWNNYCDIQPKKKISLDHLLSILFYTDLSLLPQKMKIVCRRLYETEPIKWVMMRHQEYVIWFRLMMETLIFYGSNFVHSDKTIYHGLTQKFFFDQFKAKFHIPTSTTTDKSVAKNFAHSTGIIISFNGLESNGVINPYFDTKSISAYPDENEYLFFMAELNISDIHIGTSKFSMAPLSLYQSIINGEIIMDKIYSDKKSKSKGKGKNKGRNRKFNKVQRELNRYLSVILDENKEDEKDDEHDDHSLSNECKSNYNNQDTKPIISNIKKQDSSTSVTSVEDLDTKSNDNNEVTQYGIKMLEQFYKQTRNNIFINKSQIMDKLTLPELRKRFIEIGADNSFKSYSPELLHMSTYNDINICEAEQLIWKPSKDKLRKLQSLQITQWKSKILKCKSLGLNFFCQMTWRQENEDSNNITVRLSLTLHSITDKSWNENKPKIISCDFFCKELKKYYVRFHRQSFILNKTKSDRRITSSFPFEYLKEYDPDKRDFEWVISIRDETECI